MVSKPRDFRNAPHHPRRRERARSVVAHINMMRRASLCMPAIAWRVSLPTSSSHLRCSSSKPPSSADEKAAHEKAQAEKAALELVYGEGGQPPKMPYAQIGFTAFVLGSYVAYVKLIEEPAEARALLANPEVVEAPLPNEATKWLPDGSLLMSDGSIRRPPS